MGQKINPHGFRVGVIKDWDSRWYASNEKVGDLLVEDHKIRVYLKKLLYAAGVSKIEIERSNDVRSMPAILSLLTTAMATASSTSSCPLPA